MLVTNQVELSLANTSSLNSGALDQCMFKGIRPMAWSPLGGEDLFAGVSDVSKRVLEASIDLCSYYNCEVDQLLYTWLLE